MMLPNEKMSGTPGYGHGNRDAIDLAGRFF